MRIVLLGCPGAGKGTQSMFLCRKYGLEHISTGDIFRAEIEKKSAIGEKVAEFLKRGALVPDDLVVEVAASRLDAIGGDWLLDGFPRTLGQAQALDKYLAANGQKLDVVLYLAMTHEAVIARLTGRRMCLGCGDVYNLVSRPPQAEGKCDKCGKELVHREDDAETTIKKRLMIYDDLTSPLVAYYRSQHEFVELDGAADFQDVTRSLYKSMEGIAAAGKVA